MSEKLKLVQLNLEGLKRRIEGFHQQRRNLIKSLNGNNGSTKKEARRKKRLDDLDQRLIPLAEQLMIQIFRKNQVPFGD